MINWKYICTKLSEYTNSGLGHFHVEYLIRTWKSIYNTPVELYHDPHTMDGNLALIYNFFMTIVNQTDLNDVERVNQVLFLLENILNGYYKKDKVYKILSDGRFDISNLTLGEDDNVLFSSAKYHSTIILHCKDFFLQKHYSTCVNEACKAYNKAVQDKSGSNKDGQALMLSAFSSGGNLRANEYVTESQVNEQEGIMFLSAGLMRGFRNPTAHEPAYSWKTPKEDCIEILGLVSYLFKKLDNTTTI